MREHAHAHVRAFSSRCSRARARIQHCLICCCLPDLLCPAAPKHESPEEPGDAGGPADTTRQEEFEDVLPLLEVERVQDLSHEARGEGGWETDEGLIALHTSPTGCNSGRKYCLQVTDTGDERAHSCEHQC